MQVILTKLNWIFILPRDQSALLRTICEPHLQHTVDGHHGITFASKYLRLVVLFLDRGAHLEEKEGAGEQKRTEGTKSM